MSHVTDPALRHEAAKALLGLFAMLFSLGFACGAAVMAAAFWVRG